jgi:hypothetical protein
VGLPEPGRTICHGNCESARDRGWAIDSEPGPSSMSNLKGHEKNGAAVSLVTCRSAYRSSLDDGYLFACAPSFVRRMSFPASALSDE